MKYSIEKGNLILEPNYSSQLDMLYLHKYQPYKSGKFYKQPISKTALLNFIDYYKLQPTKELLDYLFKLEYMLIFNNVSRTTSNNELLRPYQEQGVEWIQKRLPEIKACCLLWPMRTGKTRTTCIATKQYKKAIILSLSGQENNWISTYKEIANINCLTTYKRSPKQRENVYNEFNNSNECVLVGSVNTITNDINKGVFKPSQYDILIIDEIHKIKNTKTQLNKGAKQLRKFSQYCLGLTGTPVSKNINEMIPLLTLLWPDNYSKTYLSNYFFNQEYSYYSDYGTAGDLKPEKEQEWLEFIALHFSQVTKEQALPWANEPELITIDLFMEKEQSNVYEKCLKQMCIKKDNGRVEQIQEVIAQFTRLRQIITHPNLVGVSKPRSVKQDWLVEFLSNYEGDGVIVFSTHTSYLNQLYELLSKDYKVCLITGETKDKTFIANEFQNGKYDIVLANIQAGSKGITLDRADTMIFLDQDWRPDENAQAIERFTATTPDRVKFRQVYKLMVRDKFEYNGIELETMDVYMDDVVSGKIKQTELINNFKEIFKLSYLGE